MAGEITVDEIIINIVQDNKCIYDKTDVNYKNSNKKKDIWKVIFFQLKNVYDVDMSGKYIIYTYNQYKLIYYINLLNIFFCNIIILFTCLFI